MTHTQIIDVTLDVTLAHDAWRQRTGTDPRADPGHVARTVADHARYAPRLTRLLPEPARAGGAGVAARQATVQPRPVRDARGWLTVRVELAVTDDTVAWHSRWDIPLADALGPHLATTVTNATTLVYDISPVATHATPSATG